MERALNVVYIQPNLPIGTREVLTDIAEKMRKLEPEIGPTLFLPKGMAFLVRFTEKDWSEITSFEKLIEFVANKEKEHNVCADSVDTLPENQLQTD